MNWCMRSPVTADSGIVSVAPGFIMFPNTPLLSLERRIILIALDDDPLRNFRPADPERRIIPADAARKIRRVELRHLIEDLGLILERLESMREALGNVKHVALLRREHDAEMLLKHWRAAPEVEDHVVDRTPRAANQLCLLVRGGLKMHSAKRSLFPVVRYTALY